MGVVDGAGVCAGVFGWGREFDVVFGTCGGVGWGVSLGGGDSRGGVGGEDGVGGWGEENVQESPPFFQVFFLSFRDFVMFLWM